MDIETENYTRKGSHYQSLTTLEFGRNANSSYTRTCKFGVVFTISSHKITLPTIRDPGIGKTFPLKNPMATSDLTEYSIEYYVSLLTIKT